MSKINGKPCATSNMVFAWENIDFCKAKSHIIKLQKRIALAYFNRCFDKVAMLQHTLIHSFYAKVLAVKIVTSNRGKLTPGIDDVICTTADEKYQLICMLTRRGYKASPLKRIYIPKSNGTLRPLSVPTMKDRAMQTLYKFALEPIAELTADDCSFGFRPERSARGAVARCVDILTHNSSMKWGLKADIKSCFDNISHKWILENIPVDRKILSNFLKCGYIDNGVFYETVKGVPQGGCLSTVICNMTLDGLEKLLANEIGLSAHMVRYADDIVIFGENKAILVQSVLPLVSRFLAERGLKLSMEKTVLFHIDMGFDFLGYKIIQEGKDITTLPTQKSIVSLLTRVDEILKGDFVFSFENICRELNQMLRGWFNYYRGVATDHSLYGVEYDIMTLLHNLNGDKRIADFINKTFLKLDENN